MEDHKDYGSRLMQVLEDYYGDSRDSDFKEEIIEFIECCFEEIIKIMLDED